MDERLSLDLDAIRARLRGEHGARLWRSLEELADHPSVRRHIEAEFPDIMRSGAVDRRTDLREIDISAAPRPLASQVIQSRQVRPVSAVDLVTQSSVNITVPVWLRLRQRVEEEFHTLLCIPALEFHGHPVTPLPAIQGQLHINTGHKLEIIDPGQAISGLQARSGRR